MPLDNGINGAAIKGVNYTGNLLGTHLETHCSYKEDDTRLVSLHLWRTTCRYFSQDGIFCGPPYIIHCYDCLGAYVDR